MSQHPSKCVRCERLHSGTHKTCESCLEKVRAWNRAHPEQVLAIHRRSDARKYGRKVEEFAEMLEKQGGVCAICRGTSPNMVKKDAKQRALHLDHDHATNQVRGFLCGQCNTALGKFRDDPTLLTRALGYVLRGRGDARFYEVLAELAQLHWKKSQDYGAALDPYANVRSSVDFGVPAWVGAMIRGNDKISRIKSFIRKGRLENEALEDSLRDLAVYAIIALVLWEEETRGGNNEKP